MSNVYIINRGCHDYSLAEKYGSLVYLTDESFNRFSTGHMYRKFKEGLRESDHSDYILISGLTIMSSIACSMFALKHKRLNLLLHSSSGGEEKYIKRTIIMGGIE